MFLVNYFTGIFEKIISLGCYVFDKDRDSTFSTDIYVELAEEDQHKEFMAVGREMKSVEYRMIKGDSKTPALYEYYF